MTDRKIYVLFQDDNFIVINKPAGLLVHPSGAPQEETLVDWLLEKYPTIRSVGEDPVRPGIVHRLDKDTSGILVVARNQKTFLSLKKAFAEHLIEKRYRALVYGELKGDRGVIQAPLMRERGKTKVARKGTSRIVRAAETRYRVLERFCGFTYLEALPTSGRTHQIRAHLASLGHPIVGDAKYRFKRLASIPAAKRQMLHARSISFEMPAGHAYVFEAPIPSDFQEALRFLRNHKKSGRVDSSL